MALPIFVMNEKVFDAVSMGASQTSTILDVSEIGGFCVHFIFLTGTTPIGTLQVQASNDGTNFVSINSTSVNDVGQTMVNFEKQHFRYVRLAYTRTSGTGTLSAYVAAKRI